jgi:hypothetical protein
VDVYRQPNNKEVFIQGSAKFYWVKADSWEEVEAPLLKVKPEKKVSWGL